MVGHIFVPIVSVSWALPSTSLVPFVNNFAQLPLSDWQCTAHQIDKLGDAAFMGDSALNKCTAVPLPGMNQCRTVVVAGKG